MIPKFRAWDKDLEIMSYTGNNLALQISKNGIQIAYYDSFHEITNYELMQSTGLLDKNGKEIYEGDIIKNNYDELGHIKWSRGGFVYHEDRANFYLFSIGAGQPFEIVGNIYEHSHLLEEE